MFAVGSIPRLGVSILNKILKNLEILKNLAIENSSILSKIRPYKSHGMEVTDEPNSKAIS